MVTKSNFNISALAAIVLLTSALSGCQKEEIIIPEKTGNSITAIIETSQQTKTYLNTSD